MHENVRKLHSFTRRRDYTCLAQEYKIDGETNIKQPEGMYGSRLEASFHIVAGQTAAQNITRCVVTSGLEINAKFRAPCIFRCSINADEKEAGVVLVDIGGGTTDVAIFKDGIISILQ